MRQIIRTTNGEFIEIKDRDNRLDNRLATGRVYGVLEEGKGKIIGVYRIVAQTTNELDIIIYDGLPVRQKYETQVFGHLL